MGVSLFVGGGSSVVADTKLQAISRLHAMANQAESRRNRANKNNQTNLVSYTITADAAVTYAGTVTIPATMIEDATTGDISLVPQEPFGATYLPFTAGTGDLATATGPMDALIKLCKKCTYLEKQIDPNVVVTQADQILVQEDLENGQYVVTLNLPVDVSIDDTTGVIEYIPFDYLRILDFQTA
jgi:hypothetical protein